MSARQRQTQTQLYPEFTKLHIIIVIRKFRSKFAKNIEISCPTYDRHTKKMCGCQIFDTHTFL